jgi:copper chaperone
LANLLLSLGYPEKGSVAGMEALKAKGKSFVSCAIGRMSD